MPSNNPSASSAPEGENTALQRPEKRPQTPVEPNQITDAVREAWKKRCDRLGEAERQFFRSHACQGLDGYLRAVHSACQKSQNESVVSKALDWFEPLFNLVEVLMPVATAALQAYPNPGMLVLGGVVGLLQTTRRLQRYQKLTLEKLADMGRKAKRLLDYEREIYKKEYPAMHTALVLVYGDMLDFCEKAVLFVVKDVQITARIKDRRLTPFREYEAILGREVRNFEDHIEELQWTATDCDRKRLMEIRDRQVTQSKQLEQAVTDMGRHFQTQAELQGKIAEREREQREQGERVERRREKERLLNWLAPSTFNDTYEERCREHLAGTGSWLIKSDEYQQWRSQRNSDLLWVHGKPGCGKSVLAAIAVSDLTPEKSRDNTALAYVMCRWQERSSQNPTTLFGALVKQVSQQQADIAATLQSEYRNLQHGEQPGQEAIRSVLSSALENFTRVFLVIDALDECINSHELAAILLELVRSRTLPQVKVLVLSRDEYRLEQAFKGYRHLRPDRGGNEQDVKAYIDSLFRAKSRSGVKQKIRDECIERANGMFLWVKLLHESLEKQSLSDKEKLDRIVQIPGDLPSIYDRILKDIWKQDEDVRSSAFLVLTWVIHARQPLPSSAMLEAVADLNGASTLKEASPLKNPDHLVARCANLVYIDKDGQVQLCHESVRDYLNKTDPDKSDPIREYHEQKRHAHERLAQICLDYLLLENFECGPARSVGKLIALAQKHHFLTYAAMNWGWHVQQETEITTHLRDLVLRFVRSPAHRELAMQIFLYDPEDDSSFWAYAGSSNPLHILSIHGLRAIAETFANAAALAQEADGLGITPLEYALTENRHDMCLWLIQQLLAKRKRLDSKQVLFTIHLGATLGWVDVLEALLVEYTTFVDSKLERTGRTPLCRACGTGAYAAAQTLIDKGASVDLKDGLGETPLVVAAVAGQTHIVELLLAHHANPNHYDDDGGTPLHYAANSNKKIAIVEALLAKGANPHAKAQSGDAQTPLHEATMAEATNVLKAIGRDRSGLDLKSENGQTPLHYAAWFNAWKSAKELLSLGVPKEAKDISGETALLRAAAKGALETVKVLIDAQCDATAADEDGATVIYHAARSGKFLVLTTILNSQPSETWKALISVPTKGTKQTPLHAAIVGGNMDMVRFLLKVGADATARGVFLSSPLHYAAHQGNKDASRLLLEHTRDANPRNEHDDTPLHFAVRVGQLEFVIQFFDDCDQLGLKIEVNAQNCRTKSTALMVALDNGFEEMAKFLLKKSAASIPDKDGDYPIHEAAWFGFEKIVQDLLQHEGVKCAGFNGRTPLHCAAIRGHIKVLKHLITACPETLNLPDTHQATPVYHALSMGHIEISNYLLEVGADPLVVTKDKNSLLHVAAGLGDLDMANRLLARGCKGDAVDCFGNTPFHAAVAGDNIEIIEALLAAKYDCTRTQNNFKQQCISNAAEQGNLDIMRRLVSHGAQLGAADVFGRTNAHYAAQTSQYEVLKYLKNSGENLHHTDRWGNTPLQAAASSGSLRTLKYLLNGHASELNVCNNELERATPLLRAAHKGFPRTIALLLEAGADPYIRDAFGLNAVDYASYHRRALAVMHAAGHIQDPRNDEFRWQTLHSTIRACCSYLEQSPSAAESEDFAEMFHRVVYQIVLTTALLQVRDFDAARICCMEIYWPTENTFEMMDYACGICRNPKFRGNKYICQSCPRWIEICEKCYESYKDAERSLPEAVCELQALEDMVCPIRAAIPTDIHVWAATILMTYFQLETLWISSVLEEYEAWQQKYNSTGKYQALPTPGQKLLKIIQNTQKTMSKIFREEVVGLDDAEAVAKLNKEFQAHRRKERPDQERIRFTCQGHDMLCVSKEDQDAAKLRGADLDTEGKVSHAFLQKISAKYGSSRVINTTDEILSETASQKSPNSSGVQTTGTLDLRPKCLQRSFTSDSNPLGELRGSRLMATSARVSKRSASLSGEERAPKPRRTLTFPASIEEIHESSPKSINVEVQDVKFFITLQARLDQSSRENGPAVLSLSPERQTTTETVQLSLRTNPQPDGSQEADTVLQAQKAEPRADCESLSEPSKSVADAIGSAALQANLAAYKTYEDLLNQIKSTDEEIASRFNRTHAEPEEGDEIGTDVENANMLYLLVEGSATNANIYVLKAALHLTDKMSPGFSLRWYRKKESELEADGDDEGQSSADETQDGSRSEDDEDKGSDGNDETDDEKDSNGEN